MKVEPLKPFGALVEAEPNEQSILELDSNTITQLLNQHMLVLLRRFVLCSDNDYLSFAKSFGRPLQWEFGEILDLKVNANPANHIFANARVELHWDGAFVDATPHYNLFQCIHADEDERGGETLFVNTPGVVRSATAEERARWENMIIHYKTEKKAHYGGAVSYPLCGLDPNTDRKIIRYIEAFNEDNQDVNPIEITIENHSKAEADKFFRTLTERLYKSDVMYRHRWQKGDYLIADNHVLLHGRSRFTLPHPNRYIKRINIL